MHVPQPRRQKVCPADLTEPALTCPKFPPTVRCLPRLTVPRNSASPLPCHLPTTSFPLLKHKRGASPSCLAVLLLWARVTSLSAVNLSCCCIFPGRRHGNLRGQRKSFLPPHCFRQGYTEQDPCATGQTAPGQAGHNCRDTRTWAGVDPRSGKERREAGGHWEGGHRFKGSPKAQTQSVRGLGCRSLARAMGVGRRDSSLQGVFTV